MLSYYKNFKQFLSFLFTYIWYNEHFLRLSIFCDIFRIETFSKITIAN
jgi:hypothetical protein